MPQVYRTGGGYDYGRGVPPQFVEETIRNGVMTTQGNGRYSYELGTLQVVTETNGTVVTVITL